MSYQKWLLRTQATIVAIPFLIFGQVISMTAENDHPKC